MCCHTPVPGENKDVEFILLKIQVTQQNKAVGDDNGRRLGVFPIKHLAQGLVFIIKDFQFSSFLNKNFLRIVLNLQKKNEFYNKCKSCLSSTIQNKHEERYDGYVSFSSNRDLKFTHFLLFLSTDLLSRKQQL